MEPKEERTKPSSGKGYDYLRKIGNAIPLSEQPDAPPLAEFEPPRVTKLSDIRMELMHLSDEDRNGLPEPSTTAIERWGKLSHITSSLFKAAFFIAIIFLFSNVEGSFDQDSEDSQSNQEIVEPHQGDLSNSGGTATVREAYVPQDDDPNTSNDESNDQPVGYLGTLTMQVTNAHNGNTYTLDVELDGTDVERIYFPKGGWVDFNSCELDEDFQGECEDEQGRGWVFEGKN